MSSASTAPPDPELMSRRSAKRVHRSSEATARDLPESGSTATTDAGSRGSLTISEKVVRKLAARSAHELSFVAGIGGGVLGVGRQAGADHSPRADVSLDGRNVTVFLDIALEFPTDLAARSLEIRRHVTGSVERTTGLDVRRVDITVKALITNADRPRRSLQ